MTKLNVGFLHPGAMGVSVAASARNTGHAVHWVSQGRSRQTIERANKIDLVDAQTLERLCKACSVIVSVCPPHAAEEVAGQVAARSFHGLYVDANAIAPQRVKRIGALMEKAGARFVDGGIIGGPAWERGKTWLYLSGKHAGDAAACFTAGPLETAVIGEVIGKASALKMCYAAYSKGTTALLCATLAAAEALGVRAELEAEWARDGSTLAQQARDRTRGVTAKAWRFAGEMEEIAATFAEAGLPGGFHAAAADVYRRMTHFKGATEKPGVDEVLNTLTRAGARGPK